MRKSRTAETHPVSPDSAKNEHRSTGTQREVHPVLGRVLRCHRVEESAASIATIVAEHERGRAHELFVDRHGRLVDGRLIERVYTQHGWKPDVVVVADDAVLWTILSRNFGRHLTREERLRGLVAARAEVAKLPPALRQGRKTRELIAALLGGTWSERSVQKAITLHEDAPAVFARLGPLGLEDCMRLAGLPRAEQARALRAIDKGADPVAAWRKQRDKRVLGNARDAAAIAQRYAVLMVDPPWAYEDSGVGRRGAAATHYPTMTMEQLIAMAPAIDALAAEDAILLVWSTSSFLEQALALVRAWGFTYKQELIWYKEGAFGNGSAFRLVHEPLLLCSRGAWLPVADHGIPSVIQAPRGQHSAKPDAVYEAVEKLWPHVPRIELFARRARAGWDAWGAEAPAGSDVASTREQKMVQEAAVRKGRGTARTR
ncbi:MAG TPA: MT-A70 family methyltransferase [Candidatus Baltobacteraceae bacterium]|nr:MT-A70 family methyltransferase [Candidatus Baltobacteraceae bacterium]